MNHLRANGLYFSYLEKGEGPLVILLQGFPDTAHTWDHQMTALADAGYRAVAPYLRGYYLTEIPKDGFYDKATLATDIAELIRLPRCGASGRDQINAPRTRRTRGNVRLLPGHAGSA